MRVRPLILSAAILSFPLAHAQTAPVAKATPLAATAPTAVPTLVPYAGLAESAAGKPLSGEISFTFLVFKDEQGGEPLWTESQMVSVDESGQYQVQLGAGSPSGLPLDLFSSGDARWLEVQIAGQTPQARVLLLSVPYAMKAADAATLGGLPASAYALAGTASTSLQHANGVTPDAPTATTVTTTGGTAGYLPVYSGAATIDDSVLFQSGSSLGINTKTPAANLDVNGSLVARGLFTLESAGAATATAGQSSQPLAFVASAYNSSTKTAQAPTFELKAEPAGNDTNPPSATFNLLYGNGTTPAETGLSISSMGILKFAPGQTFPSSSTTGTGLLGTSTSGTGVEGTSSSGNGVLGDTAGTTLNTAGVEGVAGTGNTSGFSGIAGVWGNASAHVGVLGTSDQYPGVQGVSKSGVGVQGASTSGAGASGSSTTGAGVVGYTAGNTLGTAGTFGIAGARTSFNGIAGIWGDAAAHVGVFGSSNQYAGVFGASQSGPGVQGSSTTSYGGQFSTSSNLYQAVYASNNSSSGGIGISGTANGTDGLAISAYAAGAGATGISANATGGPDSNGYQPSAIIGYSSGDGVQGFGTAGNGVHGVSTNTSGIFGETSSGSTLDAALYGYAHNSAMGVYGFTSNGLWGVHGANSAASAAGNKYYWGGVWGDTARADGIGVYGSADSGQAAHFINNSTYISPIGQGTGTTVYMENAENSSSGAAVLLTNGSYYGGVCIIYVSGDLGCSGKVSTFNTSKDGSRKVETYSVQSAENWLEDAGTVQLVNGSAHVDLESTFGQTVNTDVEYHVFLTPDGDCKGLYVSAKSAGGFDVRELGGGKSSVAFEYRIMAKRAGHEGERLADVTQALKAATAPSHVPSGTVGAAQKLPPPPLAPSVRR